MDHVAVVDTLAIWMAYFWQWLVQSEDWIEAWVGLKSI